MHVVLVTAGATAQYFADSLDAAYAATYDDDRCACLSCRQLPEPAGDAHGVVDVTQTDRVLIRAFDSEGRSLATGSHQAGIVGQHQPIRCHH